MKTKVIKPFIDKNTGICYKDGEFFEGEYERVAELANGGFVAAKITEKEGSDEKGQDNKDTGGSK